MKAFDEQLEDAFTQLRAYRAFAAALSSWSKPLGFSSDECLMLLLLRHGDGPSNTELAASLSLNLATSTKIIDRLVSNNLVHRKPHATDRRRIQVYLTNDGEKMVSKAIFSFNIFVNRT